MPKHCCMLAFARSARLWSTPFMLEMPFPAPAHSGRHYQRTSRSCLNLCNSHRWSYHPHTRFIGLGQPTAALPSPSPRQQHWGCSTTARSVFQADFKTSAARNSLTGNSEAWNEVEFGTLQKKAASRLYRFYVPQPLGPNSSSPSLEALLLGTNAAVPPASTRPTNAHSATTPCQTPAPSTAANPSSRSRRSRSANGTAPATQPATPSSVAASNSSGASTATLSSQPAPSTVVLEGDEARHAARALRLQPGDPVELCDGRGNLVAGTVSGSDKQRVWVTTEGPEVHVPWSGCRWVAAVACTTLKGDRAEWLVEKLTELGAYMMVPLVTERSQAGGKAKFRTRTGSGASPYDSGGESDGDYQPGRLERIAIAATKQSLRAHALGLAPPTPLADVLPLVRQLAKGSGEPESVDLNPGAEGVATRSTAVAASPPQLRTPQATPAVDDGEPAQGLGVSSVQEGNRRSEMGTAKGTRTSSFGSGGTAGGGAGDFSLVAVAGAPPLRTVLDELLKAAAGPRPDLGSTSCGEHGGGEGSQQPIRVLFIGPEGDFTPAELASIVDAGAKPVGLGANRLRTETAAIGLLAACIFAEP